MTNFSEHIPIVKWHIAIDEEEYKARQIEIENGISEGERPF
jgi:hypothetical protein